MSIKKNNLGFAVAEAVLIIVIVALVAVVGYKTYNIRNSTDKIAQDTTAGSQQATSPDIAVPSAINSTGDLDQAQKALEQYDSSSADEEDLSQLDSQLATF